VDYPRRKHYTGEELKELAIKVASGLTRLGYKKGDVVLLFSGNCPEYTAVFLGCGAAGIIVSTANPVYTPGTLILHFLYITVKSCYTGLPLYWNHLFLYKQPLLN